MPFDWLRGMQRVDGPGLWAAATRCAHTAADTVQERPKKVGNRKTKTDQARPGLVLVYSLGDEMYRQASVSAMAVPLSQGDSPMTRPQPSFGEAYLDCSGGLHFRGVNY